MIVVASKNGLVGIKQAVDVLRGGGSALDAVEEGIRQVEANPDDHSVGYSGLPNLIGEVELDASIMDGRTLASGAVGAMRGFMHAISVARKVMDELPHCFLVGPGAERFAREMGFEPQDLVTPESHRIWRTMFTEEGPRAYAHRPKYLERMRELVRKSATDPEKAGVFGTVNFIAKDSRGDIACGVSTSGWAWKYPGRLGDSPIIGAGNYADNRYGAAACTGRGEMAIRAVTARSVVLYLKLGMSLEEAGREAMRDLWDLVDPYVGGMNIVAMDKDGNPAAFTNTAGATFIYMTDGMNEPEERPRAHVPMTRAETGAAGPGAAGDAGGVSNAGGAR